MKQAKNQPPTIRKGQPPEIANKPKTRKRGNPAWVKGGLSPNPKGRPPEGESWAGVIRWAGELTGTEAAAISPPELAKEFRKLGRLRLKEAATFRAFAALLFDPSASLLNALMDRAEGKLAQIINVNWREEIIQLIMEGRLTREEVTEELGDDLATELFVRAGIPLTASRAAEAPGGQTQ